MQPAIRAAASSSNKPSDPKSTSELVAETNKQPPAAEKPLLASATKLQDLPPRPDVKQNVPPSRSLRSESALNGRPSHSLPSRPDVIPSSNRGSDPKSIDRAIRDPRDSRVPDHRRGDRPGDFPRDAPDRHGYRGFDHQPSENYRHDRERPEPRWAGDKPMTRGPPVDDRYGANSRDSRPPPRDLPRDSPRDNPRDDRSDRGGRDRSHTESHENPRSDPSGRRSRDSSMAAPRSSAPVPHPDRVAAIQDASRSHPSSHGHDRGSPYDNEKHSSQRGSRNASPTRRDERSTRSDHLHRDDRPTIESRRGEESIARSHHDDSRPPTGPRTNRPADSSSTSHGDKFRESFKSHSSSNAPSDNASRLSHDNRSQESQYGRLNPDPPSGPRMANGVHSSAGRGGRAVSAVQPPLQVSTAPSSQPATQERQAPTGPASGRLPQRNSGQVSRQPLATTSAPPTPSAESPNVAGVHPDRLKAIQDSTGDVAQPSRQAPVTAPAGPRSNAQPPSEVTTAGRGGGPPMFSGNDRTRGDKRFAGLNNVLQQAGTQPSSERAVNNSIRVRSTRSSNLDPSPTSTGPPRRDHPGPTESFQPSRQELFPNRSGGGESNQPRDDESSRRVASSGNLRDSDRRPPRRRDERDRSRSPTRHPQGPTSHAPPPPIGSGRDDTRGGPRRNDPELRSHRTTRNSGPPLPPPLSERDSRRSLRDDAARDRKDDWGSGPSPPERRDTRDRRDNGPPGPQIDMGVGNGRKRPRGMDDSYDAHKRSRRGN